MREVTAYRCEYCSYTKLTKSVIKKHEAICFYNPETMSCATCIHRFCGEPFFCTIEHSEKQTTFCPAWANADDEVSEELSLCATCKYDVFTGPDGCEIQDSPTECPHWVNRGFSNPNTDKQLQTP